MTWLGMAVVAALQIVCFITIRWLAGREERPQSICVPGGSGMCCVTLTICAGWDGSS